MNNISFNIKHYLQKHVTAMGTSMAPSYANLYMGKFEQQAIDNSLPKPFIWWRFIDDIFMIWTHGRECLKAFINYLNSIHSIIKFTHEYSNSLASDTPSPSRCPSSSHQQPHPNRSPYKAHRQTSIPPQNIVSPKTTTKKPSHSASSSESATYVLRKLPLTNEAENSSRTSPNVVIVAPHYKEMPISFAQFNVMQPFNRKNRNPPRLTENPLSYPTLRFLKYHLLLTSIPLSFNPLPTAKWLSLTH